MIGLLVALFLSGEAFASDAVGLDLSEAILRIQPEPTPLAVDDEDSMGSEEDPDSDTDASQNDDDSEADTGVTNYQHNEYFFDTTSWISALLKMLSRDSTKSANKYKPILNEAARSALGLLVDFGTDGLSGIRRGLLVDPARRIWKVSFGIALALFPLVIVVNVFLAYSQGMGASTARVEMVQNLIEGMVLLGFAWGSYILINYVISIGWGLASF
ncbi:MAG: hypothetical protein PVI99_09475, partial [Anaerolineales bacterium]